MSFSNLQFCFIFCRCFSRLIICFPFGLKTRPGAGQRIVLFLGRGAQDALLWAPLFCCTTAWPGSWPGGAGLRKALLAAALVADLLCLVYFKYAAFFLENFGTA